LNSPVMQALVSAKVSGMIEPPRSWGHAEKIAFLNLPPDLQRFYVRREAERDREVRRCQNELAKTRQALEEIRKELEAVRKPEERHEEQQVHDRAH
jgi:Skp family chaperone for outer membrane proteins